MGDSVDVWRGRVIDALGVGAGQSSPDRLAAAARRLGAVTASHGDGSDGGDVVDVDAVAGEVIEAVAVAAAAGVVVDYADSGDLAMAIARVWPVLWSTHRVRSGSAVIDGRIATTVEFVLRVLVADM